MGEPLQNKLTCVGPAFTIGSTTSVTCPCPANPVFTSGGSTQTVAERVLSAVGTTSAAPASTCSNGGSGAGNGQTSVSMAAAKPVTVSAPVSVIPSRRKISHVQIHLLGPDNLIIPQPTSPTATSFAHPIDSHNLLHQRIQYPADANGSDHNVMKLDQNPNCSSLSQIPGRQGAQPLCSASGVIGSTNERRSSMTIRIMPLTNGPSGPSNASPMARASVTPAPPPQQLGASAATSGAGSGSGSGSGTDEGAPAQPISTVQQQQELLKGKLRKRSEYTSPRLQQYQQQMLHPAIPMHHSPARSTSNLLSNEGMTS